MSSPAPERLEQFRPYLMTVARWMLGLHFRHVQARFGASDVVAETLWLAHRDREQFRGTTSAELAAWLRRILHRRMLQRVRDAHADRRDVRRDQPLEQALDASSACLEACLAASGPSPGERLEQQEEQQRRTELLLRVGACLEQLPESQCEALHLRYFQGLSLREIAAQMDKPTTAIAGLLHRGLERLRELLRQRSEEE